MTMKRIIVLFLIFSVATISNLGISQAYACPPDLSSYDLTYSDITHNHGSGEHTHTNARYEGKSGTCTRWGTTPEYNDLHEGDGHGGDPPEPEPEPEPEPPEPEPERPRTPQPISVINDAIEWLASDPANDDPEKLSEFIQSHPDYVPPPPGSVPEVVDAVKTTPEGYTLEEINGQSLLVPVEPSKHISVDKSAPAKQQETFIIYTVVEVVGGQNYLQPTPFSEATDPLNPGNGEGENGVAGQSETFASINGQYYTFTTNPALPVQVTEYMVSTWGNGQGKLPQWIEVYNPNAAAISISGYEFSYMLRGEIRRMRLGHFLLPPRQALILATYIPRQRYRYGGISESQVYNLKLYDPSEKGSHVALKKGWSLRDSNGMIISQVGKAFGGTANPIAPAREGLRRKSYTVYVSERTKVEYFFGFRLDIGTPGFHEPSAPKAPSKARPKLQTSWARIKGGYIGD
ncbi:MAG: hypothetical protein OXU36_07885 [Candidatus Poribacteria bacterium]|nr:hypothetical protein [Candidatus Poribacteria bacterium]